MVIYFLFIFVCVCYYRKETSDDKQYHKDNDTMKGSSKFFFTNELLRWFQNYL